MKPLSIGVDARPLSHPKTGIGRYTDAILRRAQSSAHHFHLYAAQPLEVTYPGCAVRTAASGSSKLGSTWWAQAAFPYWAAKDRLDLFWSPRHHLPLALGIPTIVTIHDLVWRAVPKTMAPAARHVERLLMTPSVNKAKKIIAVSKSTRDDLCAWKPHLAEKVEVICEAACVVPEDCAPEGALQRTSTLPERFILFVGTFEPRKNLHRLVRAFHSIAADVPHHLVLAGGKGWGEDLQKFLDSIGPTADRIHCVHPEQNTTLAELYARCEFFALPSLYEGFGLPLTEAMAFGKPIVTAANSSLPEVAGDAAIYANAEDLHSIADALKQLATDASLRQQLSQNAITNSRRFSWDAAAEKTLSLFESVCERQLTG